MINKQNLEILASYLLKIDPVYFYFNFYRSNLTGLSEPFQKVEVKDHHVKAIIKKEGKAPGDFGDALGHSINIPELAPWLTDLGDYEVDKTRNLNFVKYAKRVFGIDEKQFNALFIDPYYDSDWKIESHHSAEWAALHIRRFIRHEGNMETFTRSYSLEVWQLYFDE